LQNNKIILLFDSYNNHNLFALQVEFTTGLQAILYNWQLCQM